MRLWASWLGAKRGSSDRRLVHSQYRPASRRAGHRSRRAGAAGGETAPLNARKARSRSASTSPPSPVRLDKSAIRACAWGAHGVVAAGHDHRANPLVRTRLEGNNRFARRRSLQPGAFGASRRIGEEMAVDRADRRIECDARWEKRIPVANDQDPNVRQTGVSKRSWRKK